MNEFLYDTGYEPALPVCLVTLSSPMTGFRVDCAAVIDTGADGTIVPIHYLSQIGARRAFEVGLRSQWG